MAVPTLASVTPSSGHSGGRTLVELTGTGFRLPTAPGPAGAPLPAAAPTVSVTFGGVASPDVRVYSSTLLHALTPGGDPDLAAASDVVVRNLDAAGAPIAGEVATAAAAWRWARPDLSAESELARVVRALIRLLERQVVKNVHFSTHTDYDDATGDQLDYAFVQKLPALILANLDVPEDRDQARNEPEAFTSGAGRFVERLPPLAVAVQCALVGVSDDPVEILNLMQATRLCFRNTTGLVLDRDAADPSKGTVTYPIDFSIAGPVQVVHAGDNSNVKSFSGVVRVEGVLLEDIAGLTAGLGGLASSATAARGWTAEQGAEVEAEDL